jgi:hypothetical protein
MMIHHDPATQWQSQSRERATGPGGKSAPAGWLPAAILLAAMLLAPFAAAGAQDLPSRQVADPPAIKPAPSGPAVPATDPAVTGEDPFDAEAFDSGVQTAVGSEDTAKVEVLAGGSFVPALSAFATEGFRGYSASGSLSGKLFAKVTVPRYGSLYASTAVSGQFLQGKGGNATTPVAKDLFVPSLALSELHYSFDIAKILFIRFGNQLISWGPSRVWTPVDFINLQKADSFQSLDLRIGKPGLRLHLPLKNSNLFGFADFSGGVQSGIVRDLAVSTNFALRYDRTFAGFEAGLSAFGGSGVQARAGLDFSGRILGSTVYGEASIFPAYGSYGFVWNAALGMDRTLGEARKLTLSGEFFYRSDGEVDGSNYAALIAAGKFSPSYVGKFNAFAGLTAEDLFSPDLSTSVSVIANLSDLSASARLTETFDIQNWPRFSLILGWTGGGAGKAYTIFSGNNALSFTAQSRIDF